MTARRITLPLIATALLGGALALGGPLAPALAHDPVTTTSPADGAVLTEVPAVFSVTTTQPMLDLSGDGAGFGMQVTDGEGLFYGDGCLTIDGATLSMPATLGAAGDYTMVFQYISSDGHTTSGSIAFTFAPTDAGTASPGSPTPPTCGVPVETPTPIPSATAETAAPEPSATPTAETPAADGGADAEATAVLALVGGIAGALALAAVVIALVVRRARTRAE